MLLKLYFIQGKYIIDMIYIIHTEEMPSSFLIDALHCKMMMAFI